MHNMKYDKKKNKIKYEISEESRMKKSTATTT